MPDDRIPPQNIAAEQSVLGSMLIDKTAIVKAIEILKPDSFYRDAHAFIYEAILDLFDKGEPVDLVTVTEAKENIRKREEGNLGKWSRIYKVPPTDFWDTKYYDLVINTYSHGPQETLDIVLQALGYYNHDHSSGTTNKMTENSAN